MNVIKAFTRVFLMAFLIAGISTQAYAQEYKEAFNTGLEAAKAKNMQAAVDAFKQSAELATEAGDDEVARKAKYYATQIDYKLGLAAYSNENYETALTHFEEGIELYPTYAKNYLGKALTLKKQDQLDDAMATFKEAIDVGTENRDRDTAGRAEEAIRSHYGYIASTALNSNGGKPNKTNAQEVMTAMEALQAHLEADADTHYYLAEAYKVMGDYEQAIAHADTALEMHRGSRTDKAKIYFTKGEALMYQGATDAAKQAFAEAAYGSYRASAEHYIETL